MVTFAKNIFERYILENVYAKFQKPAYRSVNDINLSRK